MNAMIRPNHGAPWPMVRASKKRVSILGLLHWAFQRECAGVSFDRYRDDDQKPPSFGMEYIMIEQARLGCRVDGGGVASDPHEDAMAVVDALAVLPEGCGGRRMAVWIAELARAGRTPDWMEGARPKVVPVAWRRNRHGDHAASEIIGYYTEVKRGRAMRKEIRMCPITFEPSARQIAAARRDYLGWWGALLELRTTFQVCANLANHVITDDLPPMNPWKGE